MPQGTAPASAVPRLFFSRFKKGGQGWGLWKLGTRGRRGVAGGAFRHPLSGALDTSAGVCFTQIPLSCC